MGLLRLLTMVLQLQERYSANVISFQRITVISILRRICLLAGELSTPAYTFFRSRTTILICELYKMNTSINLLAVVCTSLIMHPLFFLS
jgi:hypothetical protein